MTHGRAAETDSIDEFVRGLTAPDLDGSHDAKRVERNRRGRSPRTRDRPINVLRIAMTGPSPARHPLARNGRPMQAVRHALDITTRRLLGNR